MSSERAPRRVEFTDAHLIGPGLAALLHRLKGGDDPLAVHLRRFLPDALRTALTEADLPAPGAYAPPLLRALALDALNSLLDAEALPRHEDFAAFLEEPAIALHAEAWPNDDGPAWTRWGRRLNRMLLARAFPDALRLLRYYVSLDLGSESAAAFYQSAFDAAQGRISLQAHARMLLGADAEDHLGRRIDLLHDGPLGLADPPVSHRLRNRISLVDGRQPYPLEPDHPRLDLFDPDERARTLFGLFHWRDTELALRFLPNPKILFQNEGAALIPRVRFRDADVRAPRLDPDTLLYHLTAQVVRNLLLEAPELRQLHVEPEEVHLVLTVPNVYSEVHVEGLRAFVAEHTGVAAVDTISESDAAAYHAFYPDGAEPGETDFARALDRACERAGEVFLLTIDVGRGTTDTSLIRIAQPEANANDQRRSHEVVARNGRSDGGNRLSYVFARHFDQGIQALLARYGITGAFDFLTSPDAGHQPGPFQYAALTEFVALIEIYKRHFGEPLDERLRTKQARHIVRIIEQLLRTQDLDLVDVHPILYDMAGLPRPDEQPGRREHAAGALSIDRARDFANECWTLLRWAEFTAPDAAPDNFASDDDASEPSPVRRRVSAWRDRVRRFLRSLIGLPAAEIADAPPRLPAPDGAAPDEPFRSINAYVKANTDQLLRELLDKARLQRDGAELPADRVFVLVAGQASQFRPLRERIKKQLAALLGVDPEGTHVLFLSGETAKEACSRGAVAFKYANTTLVQRSPLSGYYGLEQGGAVLPIDMEALAEGRTVVFEGTVNGKRIIDTTYMLVFSPGPFAAPSSDGAPATTAEHTRIKPVQPRRAGSGVPRLEIRLDGEAGHPLLVVNDEPVRSLTYGDVTRPDTYAKVWPEALIPRGHG